MPIKIKETTFKDQWELKVQTTKLSKAREKAGVIGFCFESDWLRERRKFSGPITKQSKAKQNKVNFRHPLENRSKYLKAM